MVVVNGLANILPINGVTTGRVSDSYSNLFAPVGITFSIWGLIYLLLLAYVIYQFIPKTLGKDKVINKINIYFIISSVVNSVWIFAWHYRIIGLTVILMLILLYSLIKISKLTNEMVLSFKDKLFIKIPFGIYFGWITIASIANITIFLVSLGWKNFIFADQIWMIVVLFVGLVIASITTIKEKNLAYGLVPIWAYFGIYLKHTSPLEFNNMYQGVIIATIICILVFVIVNSYLLVKKNPI
jgi:hypothetical protein